MDSSSAKVRHIALSADGSGRWATAQGLDRSQGHSASIEAFHSVLHECVSASLEYLSIHAFSTENWRRPPDELARLDALLTQIARDLTVILLEADVRFRWIGRRDRVSPNLRDELLRLESSTASGQGMRLQLCVDYGGRDELFRAAVGLARSFPPQHVTQPTMDDYVAQMDDPELPDVDLYIRTGGERRFSNFLIWHAAFAELVFIDKYWPDMRGSDIRDAVKTFSKRERRLGGLTE